MKPIANQLNLTRACALFALALGVTVLVGWTASLPLLVQIRPDWTPMVLNTAVAFIVSSAALALATLPGRWPRIIATSAGLLVMLLALEELAVLAFNLSPAMSLPDLHRPLQPDYLHPGRMAPNTALAFLLVGAGVAFADKLALGSRPRALQNIALLVILIGLLGVIGYSLRLEFLYGWTGVVRMAVHTGVGVFVLGLGLWTLALQRDGSRPIEEGGEVLGVKRAATVLLVLTAASAGVGGFAFLQAQVEKQVRDNLETMALDRIVLFDQVIQSRTGRAQVAADDSELPNRLRLLVAAQAAQLESPELRRWVRRLGENGFSSIAVVLDGRSLQLGGAPAKPSLALSLQSLSTHRLLWDDGYVLRIATPVSDQKGFAGVLVTEQPLPALLAANVQTNRLGETGEMAVCGPSGDSMLCFPLRYRPQPYRLARVAGGQPRPMDYALRGIAGATIALDYRMHRVFAAYGPIGQTGLGLVVKRDVDEIYAPIRRQFQRIVVFVAVLLLFGQWVMQGRLRPLLRSLESSRADARTQSARFEAAVDSHLDSFFILETMRDASGRISDFLSVHLNGQAAQMVGLQRNEVVGHGMGELFPALREDGLLDKFIRVVETGAPMIEERQSVLKKSRWYHMQAVKLGDGIGLTVRDVTDARHDADRIRHQAMHDPLTGLANRQSFEVALTQAIIDATSRGQVSALALLDLDDFKLVNDTLGHAAGDLLLQKVAYRLQDSLRPSDFVARLGGDEFVLILQNLRYRAGAEKLARKLVAAIAQPMMLDGHEARVSASLGITLFPADGVDTVALLRQADEAMYEAKNAGRNGYVLFDRDAAKP